MRNMNAMKYRREYEEQFFTSQNVYQDELNAIDSRLGKGKDAFVSITEVADFFLKQAPEIALYKKQFSVPKNDVKLTNNQKQDIAYQKAVFVETIRNRLNECVLVTCYVDEHYTVIKSIKGNIIEYMDSITEEGNKPGDRISKSKYTTVNKLFAKASSSGDGILALHWLKKSDDPETIVSKYTNLSFNDGMFSYKDAEDATLHYGILLSNGITGSVTDGNITEEIYTSSKTK
jgi:hypothetical protein